jgi:hypothetical protein
LASYLIFSRYTGKNREDFPSHQGELNYRKLTDYMLICVKKIRVNLVKGDFWRSNWRHRPISLWRISQILPEISVKNPSRRMSYVIPDTH